MINVTSQGQTTPILRKPFLKSESAHEYKSQPHHLLATWLWASYLSLNFLSCKPGTRIVPMPHVFHEIIH